MRGSSSNYWREGGEGEEGGEGKLVHFSLLPFILLPCSCRIAEGVDVAEEDVVVEKLAVDEEEEEVILLGSAR